MTKTEAIDHIETLATICARQMKHIARLRSRIARMNAQQRLIAALEPFARAADNYADVPGDRNAEGRYIDNDATITVAMLREARAALASLRS